MMPLLWLFSSNLVQILRWDRPRIRLLRSAETFYTYANPLNQVISRIVKGRRLNEVDDFRDLIGTIQSKTAGEVHRTSMHQLWLSLSLAIAAMYFSALAVRADEPEILTPPERILSALDCDNGRWSVGPFVLGKSELLETIGRTPAIVVEDIANRRYEMEPVSIVVIGSTDSADFLPTSEIQSNEELARRRAEWAAERLREEFMKSAGTIPEIVSMNSSLSVVRLVAGVQETTTSREVLVCVRWTASSF